MALIHQKTAGAIAQLMPNIIQGAHLGIFASRTMTQTQFLLLICAHANGACPMSKIATSMKVSMPTMTGLVNRMVKAQYLKRVAHPDDRRQVLIALTPQGQKVLKQFQAILCQRWANVLEGLNDNDVKAFYQIITKLNAHIARTLQS